MTGGLAWPLLYSEEMGLFSICFFIPAAVKRNLDASICDKQASTSNQELESSSWTP